MSTDVSLSSRVALRRDLRLDAAFHQLDDINALGDAMASASRDSDAERVTALRVLLDRFAMAVGWHGEGVLAVILAYGDKHAAHDEDLFAPAFILRAVASHAPENTTLLARLPESVRGLLALLDESTIR